MTRILKETTEAGKAPTVCESKGLQSRRLPPSSFWRIRRPELGRFQRVGQQQARFGQSERWDFDGTSADQIRSPCGVRKFSDLVAPGENPSYAAMRLDRFADRVEQVGGEDAFANLLAVRRYDNGCVPSAPA